jgi:hypothetical protein
MARFVAVRKQTFELTNSFHFHRTLFPGKTSVTASYTRVAFERATYSAPSAKVLNDMGQAISNQ